MDFGELLIRAADLWRENPDLRDQYRARFPHVLVDEFQDTNAVQYRWVRELTQGQGHVFVVGDDDQAIYGWRGADIRFIRQFEQDFASAKTIKLEQNYRSTGHILAAANAVIAQNPARIGKKLFTNQVIGKFLVVVGCQDDREEARITVEAIRRFLSRGRSSHEAAVLFRTNSQSRVLEEALIAAKLPYQMRGGLRFLDRAEVKSVMAYLQLIVSRDNDLAFLRVVNLPARGLGDKTIEALQNIASEQQMSLWRTAQHFIQQKLPSPRAAQGLQQFLQLIEQLDQSIQGLSLSDQVVKTTNESGLWNYYTEDERRENLKELFRAAQQFILESEEERMPLTVFVEQAALGSQSDHSESDQGIQLMTLHGAKGLEFPFVAIVGWEEGIFPTIKALSDASALEEERRLAYVGITRAREELQLSFAVRRLRFGEYSSNEPSRFLSELPTESVEWQGIPLNFKSSGSEKRSLGLLSRLSPKSLFSAPAKDHSVNRNSHGTPTKPLGGSLVQRLQTQRPITSVKRPTSSQTSEIKPTSSPIKKQTLAKGPHSNASEISSSSEKTLASEEIQTGRTVRHPQYGLGVVRQIEGEGDRKRAEVEFALGNKWLNLLFVKLTAG